MSIHLISSTHTEINEHGISPYTILWILDYLTNRPQYVKINCTSADSKTKGSTSRSQLFISDTVYTNTHCLHGDVLSPYLFSIYTSHIRESHEQCSLNANRQMTQFVLIKGKNCYPLLQGFVEVKFRLQLSDSVLVSFRILTPAMVNCLTALGQENILL